MDARIAVEAFAGRAEDHVAHGQDAVRRRAGIHRGHEDLAGVGRAAGMPNRKSAGAP